MIDKKFAAQQLERMTGLSYFPAGAALKELRLAIESAASDAIAAMVVSKWLEESTEAPRPAQLRNLIAEENAKLAEKRVKCSICGGVGFVTIWKLVTYKGNSYTVASARTLPVESEEEAMEYTRGLVEWQRNNPNAPNQTVLSAAKDCVCRPVGRESV